MATAESRGAFAAEILPPCQRWTRGSEACRSVPGSGQGSAAAHVACDTGEAFFRELAVVRFELDAEVAAFEECCCDESAAGPCKGIENHVAGAGESFNERGQDPDGLFGGMTCGQRCQIYALKKRGFSNSQIAGDLGVHRCTIGRELTRNSGRRGYRCKQAEEKCQVRRHATEGKHRKLTPAIRLIGKKLTTLQLSPEQIAGWLTDRGGMTVSHESIYQHIWRDKHSGGALWKNLRRKQQGRYRQSG